MVTLLKDDAISAVRKNLDEQGLNDSVMYVDDNADNDSLDAIIAKTLPEAINDIHAVAPAHLLEGEDYKARLGLCYVFDRVLHFEFDAKLLRLAAFQAADSPIVVTDVIPEASAEGRKQLNQFVRGTWDNPRLVMQQGKTYTPTFRYYTLKDDTYLANPSGAVQQLRIIRQLFHSDAESGYPVSAALVDSAIYQLTALVCAIHGKVEVAGYFSNKAVEKWKTS